MASTHNPGSIASSLLSLRRAREIVALTAISFAGIICPRLVAQPDMPAAAIPEFKTVTIKLSSPPPDLRRTGCHKEGARVSCDNETIVDLIATVYGVHPQQVIGAPSWTGAERYNLDGIPDQPGSPNANQMKAMYRSLLATRFNLYFHPESRVLPVYEIRTEKTAPKIAESRDDFTGTIDTTFTEWSSQTIALKARNASISDLASTIDIVLDRPVVDRSGLSGRFDFILRWAPATSITDPTALPGIFGAIQEELGLRLVPAKASVDVLVIDHIDKPSVN